MAEQVRFGGSTSEFYRIRKGVVLKSPARVWEQSSAYQRPTDNIAMGFTIEHTIFKTLGDHPRIVRYFGWQQESPQGLLLAEASHGNLQHYLDENNTIPLLTRKKWCRQVIDSIQYIHSQGIIHSDLRPDNFLVHAISATVLDLWLCDFGGSTCDRLGLDGKHLPDPGFFDPNGGWVSNPLTDIFSAGSILYTIITGHWPYRSPGPFGSVEEEEEYDKLVEDYFRERKFPDTQELYAGKVIYGCWMKEYASADEILQALDLEDKAIE